MPYLSPYILTEEWANASVKGGRLLRESQSSNPVYTFLLTPLFPAEVDYLLSDAAAEQKWAFKFAEAMARAEGPKGGSSLFNQMTFYVTPKIGVDTKLLRNVVSAVKFISTWAWYL